MFIQVKIAEMEEMIKRQEEWQRKKESIGKQAKK